MRLMLVMCFMWGLSMVGIPSFAQDAMIERVLRAQVFNKAFEGFAVYQVTIEQDQPQADGSREVVAVASGTFSDQVQRIKALFLIVGEEVIGGQFIEGTGLPPCRAVAESGRSSL
ncbi:MAG: hypothetical protein AB7F94_02445 [Nitrospira sp.]